MIHSKLIKGAAYVGLLMAATVFNANATIILMFDSTSTSSNSPATGASAWASLEFSNVSGSVSDGVKIDMIFRNTTGEITSFGAGATTSKLTGVAFDLVEPNSGLGTSFVAGAFLDTLIIDADANPFGTIDIGIADNGNFIGGSANGALPQATQDTASFVLFGTTLVASALETAFASGFGDDSLSYVARFQQVNAGAGSDKLNGGTCCDTPGGPQAVPEPSTLALFALGLLGIGMARKGNQGSNISGLT